MRMILIALLTLMTATSVALAVDYNYDFKPGTQCANPNHTTNMTGMASIRDKLTQVILGVEDADKFQEAWLESIGVEDTDKFAGEVDALFIYKNYPSAGMFVAFKDGCYYGHVQLTLDKLNNILYQYEVKTKGL